MLIDFVAKITHLSQVAYDNGETFMWKLFTNGSSNNKRSEVGIILKGLKQASLKYSLKFEFKATNNESKYEVLIANLKLSKKYEQNESKCIMTPNSK